MHIPTNFKNLITDFAREVIRNQPKNIYEFGANYFADLEGVPRKFEQQYEESEQESIEQQQKSETSKQA